MIAETGIYVGSLRHRRFQPVRHEFSYPVFMAMLDVDRIPEMMRVSPFASFNRWNWAGYDVRDHFGDPELDLRERLRRDAAAHGVTLPDGPAFLLTNLRYLGYCFNPVSFYYLYGRSGALEMMLAEVNNTFGETCNYWLTPECEPHPAGPRTAGPRRYETRKVFHVSPFIGLGHQYTWIFTPPGDRLVAHMNLRARIARDPHETLRRLQRGDLVAPDWMRRWIIRCPQVFPRVEPRLVLAVERRAPPRPPQNRGDSGVVLDQQRAGR